MIVFLIFFVPRSCTYLCRSFRGFLRLYRFKHRSSRSLFTFQHADYVSLTKSRTSRAWKHAPGEFRRWKRHSVNSLQRVLIKTRAPRFNQVRYGREIFVTVASLSKQPPLARSLFRSDGYTVTRGEWISTKCSIKRADVRERRQWKCTSFSLRGEEKRWKRRRI